MTRDNIARSRGLTYPGGLLLRGMQLRVFLLEMWNKSRRVCHGEAHRDVERRCDDARGDLRRTKCTLHYIITWYL